MKTNLRDTTFLIAIRLDSISRLENVIVVTDCLCKYFDTNIILLEADNYNNGVLKSLLHRKVQYQFIEDKDPIFYRTMYFNQMISEIHSPYIALWDADIVIDKNAIIEAVEKLRNCEYNVAYPYNGKCFDIPQIIRRIYLQKPRIKILYDNVKKMDSLYPHLLTGGGVFINKEKYVEIGMENEKHYGWGNDDFDRYYRFLSFGYRIYRVDKPLFHLFHTRGDNSRFRSEISAHISSAEKNRVASSSKNEM